MRGGSTEFEMQERTIEDEREEEKVKGDFLHKKRLDKGKS